MLKELISYLMDFGKAEDRIEEIDERNYHVFGNSCNIINPPAPQLLEVSGLAGVVEFVKRNGVKDSIVIRVASRAVIVYGGLDEKYMTRNQYLKTDCSFFDFQFGRFYSVEEFIILLQSQFDHNDDRQTVLKLVGNIKDGQVIQRQDDGVTQEVTARVGITKLENVPLVNPVNLKPKRSFPDIEQVETPFIIRGKSGNETPSFALFEADGGLWKVEANKRIKEFLKAGIDSDNVLII